MLQRFVRDEAGMTMGITVIMVVLIGVMGAGLLTFVSTDLNTVVEVNQGQRALEAADAGVEAAKQQLVKDLAAEDRYDGGTDDLPWSYCYNVTACTGVAPTATGSAGMRLDMPNGDYANVTILNTVQEFEVYRVISEGRAGKAKRKVEAIIQQNAKVSAPATYFSRSDITLQGSSSNVAGISLFALKNFEFASTNASLGMAEDARYGRWAETSGAGPYPNALGSFPNTFNKTARPSSLAGVGAGGVIFGPGAANAFEGTRSFDSDTPVTRVVPDYNASALPASQKIAFPFKVPTPAQDKEEIDVLRQRALALEQANPGTRYFIDSNPGNGVDDPGMPNLTNSNSPLFMDTWPSGSDDSTVVVYKFASYSPLNRVQYRAGASGCATTTNRGVWMVLNGDAVFEGNRRHDGPIFVRAYDASGNLLSDSGGLFNGAGSACLNGYVNTSGDQVVAGNFSVGSVPELGNLALYRGSMTTLSWRELYE